MLAQLNSGFRREDGQTLILVVLMSVVLMGFLGLAIDVGNARTSQRKMQQAADAAAIAAVLELNACGTSPCTEMTTASTKAVSENGLTVASGNVYTNQCTLEPLTGAGAVVSGTNAPYLIVNWGPCLLGTSDPNKGKKTYVEAAVAENQPAFFANIFGISTFAVTARAEAKIANSPWCIFGLDSIEVGSGGSISTDCGGYTDGNVTNQGNGSKNSCQGTQISLSELNAAGSVCKSNKIQPSPDPAPVTNAPAMTDPLLYLTNNFTPPSSVTGACQPTGFTYPWGTTSPVTPGTGGTWTLTPSSTYAYCATSISNGNALEVNKGDTVILAGCNNTNGSCTDGTFIFNGNVQLDNQATLTSVDPSTSIQYGDTLYFTGTSGTLTTSYTNTTINLFAPTGCYGSATASSWESLGGILYWENSSDTSNLTIPNGYKTIWQGAVYVPGATIFDTSGSNSTMGAYTVLDAKNVGLSDGATIGADYSSLCGGSPIKTSIPALAE